MPFRHLLCVQSKSKLENCDYVHHSKSDMGFGMTDKQINNNCNNNNGFVDVEEFD